MEIDLAERLRKRAEGFAIASAALDKGEASALSGRLASLADSDAALLREAAAALGDLRAERFVELSDEQIVAMLGGYDAAEEAASHVRYIARVAIREASAIGRLREIQQAATLGLTDSGCVEGDIEHRLFTDVHRLAVQAMQALSPMGSQNGEANETLPISDNLQKEREHGG